MSETSKDTLRTEARRHRARMDIRDEDPQQACEYFFSAIKPSEDKIIGGYWPSGSEFDSRPIVERLIEQGNVCSLPVVQKDSPVLRFVLWDNGMDLKEGAHKVLEPVITEKTVWVEPDIVIVPLLAFDRRGYRLGQGGGHYDATLASLRIKKDIIAVGLAYGQQACLFNLPVEPHDQKLDWVITPQGAQSF